MKVPTLGLSKDFKEIRDSQWVCVTLVLRCVFVCVLSPQCVDPRVYLPPD